MFSHFLVKKVVVEKRASKLKRKKHKQTLNKKRYQRLFIAIKNNRINLIAKKRMQKG